MATSVTIPPPFSASAIEEVCKVLGNAVKGDQIPNLIAPLKVPEEPGGPGTKWKRLFNAVIARQNKSQDGKGLVRLVMEVMVPVRFGSTAEFEATRTLVNERLLLSGFEDGKVVTVRAARTVGEAQQRADDLRAELARRDVHSDVLAFCRAELLQQNYFHAVLEASKSVAEKLRNLAGVTTGIASDGTRLVNATCFPAATPRVRFNALATDWERSEQTGIANLMMGLFSAFRNPAAHAPRVAWATSRSDALDMLTLASMLHRRFDKAVVRQTVP
jgi:uncharacterized protein (TIGR02391 family)